MDRSELATRKEDIAVLYDTIHDLTSTLSMATVIERLLDRVSTHLGSEIASILTVGRDQRLRIAHAIGLPDDVVRQTSIGVDEGISGHVFHTGEGILIQDVESDPRFAQRNHERYCTHSAISVPLRINDKVIGVLNVNNRRDGLPFDTCDLHLVRAIAAHAAVALSNAHSYEQTLRRAQFDALTGLANHGHFWTTLEIEMRRAQRYGRPLSLVMIDLDRFREFNEEFGYRAGDEALFDIAQAIRSSSRVHDFPARFGGSEFAVLLPDTPAAGGTTFAEKVRQRIDQGASECTIRGGLTVSLGVAAFPDHAGSGTGLVDAAHAHLAEAKQRGGNRIQATAPA